MKFACVVVFCLLGLAYGQVSQYESSTHPDHPGKCWIEKHKAAVAPGENFRVIGDCTAYECHKDFSYSGYGCGLIGARPPCYQTPVDNTKLHPDCCPQHKCDKE